MEALKTVQTLNTISVTDKAPDLSVGRRSHEQIKKEITMEEENVDYSGMSIEEKVKHFEDTVVQSPLFTEILKRIDECRLRRSTPRNPEESLLQAIPDMARLQ